MKNFKILCPGDGFTKTVSAASLDEAVNMFMVDEELKAHLPMHPELAGLSPEEMKAKLMGMVTEEMAAPAGEMGGGMPMGGAPTGGAM